MAFSDVSFFPSRRRSRGKQLGASGSRWMLRRALGKFVDRKRCRWLGGGLNYFYVYPYLGKSSELTHIFFQMDWNHQPDFRYSLAVVSPPATFIAKKTLVHVISTMICWPLQQIILVDCWAALRRLKNLCYKVALDIQKMWCHWETSSRHHLDDGTLSHFFRGFVGWVWFFPYIFW